MNDRPFYCAACAHHGTNKHDPGCPNDDSPLEALRVENRRLRALLTEAHGWLHRTAACAPHAELAERIAAEVGAPCEMCGGSGRGHVGITTAAFGSGLVCSSCGGSGVSS